MLMGSNLLRWRHGSGHGKSSNVDQEVEQRPSRDSSTTSRFFDSSKSTTLKHSSITSQTAANGGLLLNLNITHHNQASTDAAPPQQSSDTATRHPLSSTPKPRAQVYYDSLLPEGRGSPLYTPGPDICLPREYRKAGVGPGDVVIISNDGGVSYLFNIFASADDPINRGRVPQGFRPLPTYVAQMEQHPCCANVVMSSSVRSSSSPNGLGFETSQEGALLALPSGATSTHLVNTKFFDKYIARNCEDWYYFVLGRGRPVENGDIRLVVGCDKTTTWGTATFLSQERTGGQVIFKTPGDGEKKDHCKGGACSGGSGAGVGYTYQCFGSAVAQTGPRAAEMKDLREPGSSDSDTLIENQCVFLRTINPCLSEEVYQAIALRVEAEGFGEWDEDMEPNTTNAQAQRHGAGAVRLLPGSSNKISINHPSDGINKHLLAKFPKARVVITGDYQWTSVVKKNEQFPSREQLIDRIEKAYTFWEEDGTVSSREPEQPFICGPLDLEFRTKVDAVGKPLPYSSIGSNHSSSESTCNILTKSAAHDWRSTPWPKLVQSTSVPLENAALDSNQLQFILELGREDTLARRIYPQIDPNKDDDENLFPAELNLHRAASSTDNTAPDASSGSETTESFSTQH